MTEADDFGLGPAARDDLHVKHIKTPLVPPAPAPAAPVRLTAPKLPFTRKG